MRLNKYIALASGISRRNADTLIEAGRITVNNKLAVLGQSIAENDTIHLDGKQLQLQQIITLIMHKPVGYVCSRNGQGSHTVYELLPQILHHLKTVGRLDKDSSGLLLMTNDGKLAQSLTHPSYQKDKKYKIQLDKPLKEEDKNHLIQGIALDDGISKLRLQGKSTEWEVILHEGRNRQIRRSFAAIGYKVLSLHRTSFGEYELKNLPSGEYKILEK